MAHLLQQTNMYLATLDTTHWKEWLWQLLNLTQSQDPLQTTLQLKNTQKKHGKKKALRHIGHKV